MLLLSQQVEHAHDKALLQQLLRQQKQSHSATTVPSANETNCYLCSFCCPHWSQRRAMVLAARLVRSMAHRMHDRDAVRQAVVEHWPPSATKDCELVRPQQHWPHEMTTTRVASTTKQACAVRKSPNWASLTAKTIRDRSLPLQHVDDATFHVELEHDKQQNNRIRRRALFPLPSQ